MLDQLQLNVPSGFSRPSKVWRTPDNNGSVEKMDGYMVVEMQIKVEHTEATPLGYDLTQNLQGF